MIMKIKVDLPDETMVHLNRMVQESNFSVADLVEVAVYNLVALWLRDKHLEESLVAFDDVDGCMGISGNKVK